jgi:hypothetical protein
MARGLNVALRQVPSDPATVAPDRAGSAPELDGCHALAQSDTTLAVAVFDPAEVDWRAG